MTTNAMMSVREVRNYTGLSKTTVFKLINEGKLHRVKVLGRTLIARASVEALCEQSVERPLSAPQPKIEH